MGKFLVTLVGLGALAGGGYAYRNELEPLAVKYVPAPIREQALSLASQYGVPALDQAKKLAVQYLPPQVSAAFAGNDKGTSGGAVVAAKPGDKPAGEPKRDAAQDGKQGGPPAKGKAGGPPPSPVMASLTQLADMPVILSSPATVEAMATVQIKPRVDGQVVEVGFKEGDLVIEGSTLYRLDDRLARAQIKQAEATVARDRASLKDAESILDRKETLLRNKYASEQQTETARQQVEVLKANIAAGLATVDAQKTQLDYLTIRAPITGRTGSINAKLGSFVRSADPLPLLTINQTKPIAVSFALPQFNLDAMKTAVQQKAVAVITVPGVRPLKVKGRLFFVDNQVDKTTGTLTGKIMIENEDEALWPGQAVTVDLTVEIRKDMVAVTASGILPAQQGMIAWVIAADNTVSIRNVKQERVIDQIAYVSEGLKPGERVVIDGQLRLAPGGRVNIQETRTPTIEKPASMETSGSGAPAATPPAPSDEAKKGEPAGATKTPAASDATEPRRNKRG